MLVSKAFKITSTKQRVSSSLHFRYVLNKKEVVNDYLDLVKKRYIVERSLFRLEVMIAEFTDQTKLLMQLYYSRLCEKDRRHYAALESLKLGRGGTTYISKVLAVDRGTIIQGRKELTTELEACSIPPDKQRRAGGGRKKNGKIS